MEWLGEEPLEKVVNMAAKINCITEDQGLCYCERGSDGGWDKPCKVNEGGTRDWVLEDSWDVTDLLVVDWKSAMGVVVDMETKGLHDGIKGLARREGCTDSNPGDVGWNARAEEAN